MIKQELKENNREREKDREGGWGERDLKFNFSFIFDRKMAENHFANSKFHFGKIVQLELII